jgi:AAA+ ATPase superfamily predicted ATPase
VLNLPIPLIIIGSAASGKTALMLEKIKTLKGKVLYVTLSPYLTENSRNLYYAHNYYNEGQEVEFLSLYEYLSAIEVPKGKEVDFKAFEQWIWRYRTGYIIHTHQVHLYISLPLSWFQLKEFPEQRCSSIVD